VTDDLPIPHREPFRFVARAESVTADQGLFTYPFPKTGESFALRMFPQLLCVEAMAQAAAAFHGAHAGGGPEAGTLASVDRVRFLGAPRPGDTLVIKVQRTKVFGDLVMFDGEVWVHHRMVAQAEIVVRRQPVGEA
jgi:predicted hotdog family 3-hydroxylacyl-ACP dehydratase